jgi:hypothetical protein
MKKYLFINVLSLVLIFSVLSCSENDLSSSSSGESVGVAGSLSRFAIGNNILYTVDNSKLRLFDISNAADPVFLETISLSLANIETAFINGNTLYIGANNGMEIYDISNPSSPVFLSTYNHSVACDPVVADSAYAYVTLHSRTDNTRCGGMINELQIIDIRDKRNPRLVQQYQMTKPLGLGLHPSTQSLFVCDDGIKRFNVANSPNIFLEGLYRNIDASDVIPLNDLLLSVGPDGLTQFRITNDTLVKLSTIALQ